MLGFSFSLTCLSFSIALAFELFSVLAFGLTRLGFWCGFSLGLDFGLAWLLALIGFCIVSVAER